ICGWSIPCRVFKAEALRRGERPRSRSRVEQKNESSTFKQQSACCLIHRGRLKSLRTSAPPRLRGESVPRRYPLPLPGLNSSSSSSDLGQSSRSKRLSERSASSLPPVWQLTQ